MYVWAMRFGDKSLKKPEYVSGVEFRTARMTRKLLHILELANIIKTFENEFWSNCGEESFREGAL